MNTNDRINKETKPMKHMKKVLGLILVIALAVVLCVSCAKKAEEETAEMKIRFVNASGAELTKITLKERIGSKHQEWATESLADGSEITMTINTAVKDGAPDLELFYNNGTTQYGIIISEKGDKTITFKPDAGGDIIAEVGND